MLTDPSLSLSLPVCQVTLMLMDQGPSRKHLGDAFKPDPNSSSFRRPAAEMNIASGCPLFVSQSVLETGSYIKDDTIFIKVSTHHLLLLFLLLLTFCCFSSHYSL